MHIFLLFLSSKRIMQKLHDYPVAIFKGIRCWSRRRTWVWRRGKENVKIKASILDEDEESSPCYHGRVGDSRRINTPGCQTVKFLRLLRAKCQRDPAAGSVWPFGSCGNKSIIEEKETLKEGRKNKAVSNCAPWSRGFWQTQQPKRSISNGVSNETAAGLMKSTHFCTNKHGWSRARC